MGSINDFARAQIPAGPSGKRRGLRRRWLLLSQILGAIILVFSIWHYSLAPGLLGDYARYFRAEGLSLAESWFPMEEILPAGKTINTPEFILPVSGIVVRDFSQSAEEGQANAGVLIRGEEGERVKASAGGIINSVIMLDGFYLIEIDHENGFKTLYGGLSKIEVIRGQRVKAGAYIATLGQEPLSFSLLQEGKYQDPLLWLFIKS